MAHFTKLLALFLFAEIASTASAQVPGCTADDPDVACILQGAVRGVVEGDMLAFKGIPYARPPVGPLRWKPTEAAEGWSGVRDGSRFGAICPQIIGQEIKGDEDCLTVNVWRPRVKPAQALPVMVWLTGGGNHLLSGQGSAGFGGLTYSGEKFVLQGVVFVSYNLRLGVLGSFWRIPRWTPNGRRKSQATTAAWTRLPCCAGSRRILRRSTATQTRSSCSAPPLAAATSARS
jgi:para-nitrobenzyl esterase